MTVNQGNTWHVVVAANAAALHVALHLLKVNTFLRLKKKKNLDSGLASILGTLAPFTHIAAKERTNRQERIFLFMLEMVVVGLARFQRVKIKQGG